MKTLLVTFTNGMIKEFVVKDETMYYAHNLVDSLNNKKAIQFNNEIIACSFIQSIEDISEDVS